MKSELLKSISKIIPSLSKNQIDWSKEVSFNHLDAWDSELTIGFDKEGKRVSLSNEELLEGTFITGTCSSELVTYLQAQQMFRGGGFLSIAMYPVADGRKELLETTATCASRKDVKSVDLEEVREGRYMPIVPFEVHPAFFKNSTTPENNKVTISEALLAEECLTFTWNHLTKDIFGYQLGLILCGDTCQTLKNIDTLHTGSAPFVIFIEVGAGSADATSQIAELIREAKRLEIAVIVTEHSPVSAAKHNNAGMMQLEALLLNKLQTVLPNSHLKEQHLQEYPQLDKYSVPANFKPYDARVLTSNSIERDVVVPKIKAY